MIEFMSSWVEQVVLAVVVATIIEMVLPQNKNKKYIQMVIGVYVLFNIISPIIKNKEEFSVEKYNIENYQNQTQYEVDQTSMDERLEKIYLDELENIVKAKFEENDYKVIKCNVDAVLNSSKRNAGIHSIYVKIEGEDDERKIANIKSDIAEELEIEEDKINVKRIF